MSGPSAVPRAEVTKHLLAELKTGGLPVGDMGFPDPPYGWQGDNPQENDFIPYMSLSVGPAQGGDGSFGDSSSEWLLNYVVTHAGVTRAQTENVADKMRLHLVELPRLSLTHTRSDTKWRITHYRCTRIGGVQKITGSFPDYFIQMDEFTVRVSKER